MFQFLAEFIEIRIYLSLMIKPEDEELHH